MSAREIAETGESSTMHGIYVMAIITTIWCILVYGAALYKACKEVYSPGKSSGLF